MPNQHYYHKLTTGFFSRLTLWVSIEILNMDTGQWQLIYLVFGEDSCRAKNTKNPSIHKKWFFLRDLLHSTIRIILLSSVCTLPYFNWIHFKWVFFTFTFLTTFYILPFQFIDKFSRMKTRKTLVMKLRSSNEELSDSILEAANSANLYLFPVKYYQKYKDK